MSILLKGAGRHSTATGDPYFSSVVFLAGWEGSDGATSYSEEKNGRAATFVGNAQIDTAQSKFGSSSVLFDGTGDQVTFADNADWDISDSNSAEFTLEGWTRFNTLTAANRGVMAQKGLGSTAAWIVSGSSTIGEFTFSFTTDGSTLTNTVTSGASIATGTWFAWCVEKDATGKIRIYIDGVMRGSSTPANSDFFNSNAALVFGAQDTTGTVDMDGWIDEVRITKGVARYASDSGYTVPTSAFPRF